LYRRLAEPLGLLVFIPLLHYYQIINYYLLAYGCCTLFLDATYCCVKIHTNKVAFFYLSRRRTSNKTEFSVLRDIK
jgi:hypothetical protein